MMSDSSSRVDLDISMSRLPPHTIALWWLGQASVVVQSAETRLYFDPFLSVHPARQVQPLFAPEESPAADYVFCTHEHWDHLDPKTLPGLVQASPHARFVVPSPLREQLIALGIAAERILCVQPDEELDWGALKLFPLPAMHGLTSPPARYDFGFVERENQPLYRYLGYVVELAGIRIYHAGDTIIYDGLVERLRKLQIDIAFLPINGRNYFREQQDILGNMDEREAADLAAAAGIPVLIPIHYEMFAANRGRPGVLVDYVRTSYPQLSCVIPAHGHRLTYLKEAR